jgi:cyclase
MAELLAPERLGLRLRLTLDTAVCNLARPGRSLSVVTAMRRLSKSVYTEIYFEGCNPSFIETSDGAVMIDSPQNAIDAIRWRERIHQHGPIRYIINTEPHADHTIGNAYFPEAEVVGQVGLKEVFHEFLYKVADRETRIERAKQRDPDSVWLMEHPDYPPHAPTITFEHELTLEVGNHVFHCLHTPGHTDQQTSIYVPQEGIIFPGDNIFCRCKSYIQDGDPWQWLQALKDLAKFDVETIVPGHGEPCGKDYIAEQAQIIENWIGLVERSYDRGMTEDEAATQPLDVKRDLDPWPIGQGSFRMSEPLNGRNIRNIYRQLKKRREAGWSEEAE